MYHAPLYSVPHAMATTPAATEAVPSGASASWTATREAAVAEAPPMARGRLAARYKVAERHTAHSCRLRGSPGVPAAVYGAGDEAEFARRILFGAMDR